MNSKRLTIEGKTRSHGTNSCLLCPINVTFNLPNKVLINYHNTDFCSVGVSTGIECICLKDIFLFLIL